MKIRTIYQLSLLSVFCLTTICCSKTGDATTPDQSGFPGLIEEEIANASLLPTSLNGVFKLSDGSDWNYRLTVSKEAGDQLVPLIIGLHWGGGEDTYNTYSQCLAEDGFKELPCILFAPEDDGLHWGAAENRKRIEDFVNLAIKHWPVDSERVVVTGYSNGGIGSWEYALNSSDYFSAAIPMAGSYSNNQKIDIPMYAIHGELDELFSTDAAKIAIDQSINLGSNIKWVIAKDLSHYEACNYVSYLQDAVTWLKEEVWK